MNYGGQSLIEGVMMRGEGDAVAIVRNKQGELVRADFSFPPTNSRIPVLRGILALYSAVKVGISAMRWSANQNLGERKLTKRAVATTTFIAFIFNFLLYIYLPTVLADHSAVKEGVFRAIIITLYFAAIGFIPNVKRLFQYHGAEHKTVNCFESGLELTIENVKNSSRLHPRCGTGLVVVFALSTGFIFIPLSGLPIILGSLARIVLMPIAVGVAYEGVKSLVCIRNTAIGKILLSPILAAQYLTTREPDASQCEVGIAALEAVLPMQYEIWHIPSANMIGLYTSEPEAKDELHFLQDNLLEGETKEDYVMSSYIGQSL